MAAIYNVFAVLTFYKRLEYLVIILSPDTVNDASLSVFQVASRKDESSMEVEGAPCHSTAVNKS